MYRYFLLLTVQFLQGYCVHPEPSITPAHSVALSLNCCLYYIALLELCWSVSSKDKIMMIHVLECQSLHYIIDF